MYQHQEITLDPNKFPPFRTVFKQHIKRTWFTTKLYKTAYMAYPVSDHTPIDYGWKLSKCGNYPEINWFEGDQVPPEIESLEETNISNKEMINKYDETVTAIYMKVMKVTIMMVPIVMISDLKIIYYYFSQCDAIRGYISCCCLPFFLL